MLGTYPESAERLEPGSSTPKEPLTRFGIPPEPPSVEPESDAVRRHA